MNNDKFREELPHNKFPLCEMWKSVTNAIGYEPYGYVIMAIKKKEKDGEFFTFYSNLTDKQDVCDVVDYGKSIADRIKNT